MTRDSEKERERRNKEKEEEGGQTKRKGRKEEEQGKRGRRRKNKEREGAEPEIMTRTVWTLTIIIIPFSFLISSRPLSVSMGNTIKWLKFKITNIPPNTPDIDVR